MKIERIRLGILVGALLGVVVFAVACATPAAAPTAAPAAPTSAPAAPTTAPAAPTTAPAATETAQPAAPVAKAVTVQLAKNDALGSFLTDGDGNTLYLFTKDVPGTSNCYDKCAAAWPAVLPAGDATLKEGVMASLVGTTMRKDGSSQLTYNGWPLYYYAKDTKPGDTTGQAVGKVWWVVSAEGNPIKPGALAVTEDAKYGKFLADDAGRSLYMFTKDTKDTTNCYDKCEQAWPPLLSLGDATLGEGVDKAMVGTTMRKDGTVQVTYNGMPLYYYAKDAKPGDTTGQNVGTVWFLVAPDGTIIKTAP